MTTEYTIPLAIRASLAIVLEPEQPLTRDLIDEAIDGFNTEWENHALTTGGPGTIYADCTGPLNNDWRGETHDKITGDSGTFDLRTDAEKAERLDAIEDLMRELLAFQAEHFDSNNGPANAAELLEFFKDWRRRARMAFDARR
jgi:hypothetical protein